MAIIRTGYFTAVFAFFYHVLCVSALSCYNRYSLGYFNYEYCYGSNNDCCGSYGRQYCCYTAIEGGAIAGIVIGSLIGLGILVAVIIACCVAMNKSKRTTGTIITPAGGAGGVMVMNSTSHQQGFGGAYPPYGGQGYGHPAPGPAYPTQPGYPQGQTPYPPPYDGAKY